MKEEIIYSTKYALLQADEYKALNQAISRAKGYPDDSDTERYAPEEPERDINNLCVMPIAGEVQENFSSIIEGVELFDNFTPQIQIL